MSSELEQILADGLELRAESQREIEVRLVTWGEVGPIASGFESFQRGAFEGVDPSRVVLRNQHSTVVGRGLELREDGTGAVMSFRVSATPAGDEVLTLVGDGVLRGVSVGFLAVPGGDLITRHDGRRHTIRRRVDLREASVTFMPTYESAQVLAIRSRQEGQAMQTDITPDPTPDPEPMPEPTPPTPPQSIELITREIERAFQERERRQISPPSVPSGPSPASMAGTWVSVALRALSGERVPELEIRALADLVTSGNLGVVPDAILDELIDPISRSRPFLESTRQLPTPESGMNLLVPRITTRPTVGEQLTEKAAITSTVTAIGTGEYPFRTFAGGGDLSIQLLRRSSPSFLSLYLELLAEAYAVDADDAAVTALIAAVPTAGGVLDPEDLNLGAAYTNAFTNWSKRPPDTIWLSPEAVARFIDAKSGTIGAPLYSNLTAEISAGRPEGGGAISGLRPVVVPALSAQTEKVIVGPSRGFVWAEDGTFTLQADNPERLGRDVALAGMIAMAPVAPLAFTTYTLPI